MEITRGAIKEEVKSGQGKLENFQFICDNKGYNDEDPLAHMVHVAVLDMLHGNHAMELQLVLVLVREQVQDNHEPTVQAKRQEVEQVLVLLVWEVREVPVRVLVGAHVLCKLTALCVQQH